MTAAHPPRPRRRAIPAAAPAPRGLRVARIARNHGIAIEAEASNAVPSSPDTPSRGTAVPEDEKLSLTRQDVGSAKRD